MNFKLALFIFIVGTLVNCSTKKNTSQKSAVVEAENTSDNPTPFQTVNTFIGTGGHGHTYPGATSPFGLVQLSPDTRLEGWDGCGGYHYSDSAIYGFSHTHLQGTGVPDYCDILFMPTNYKTKIADTWKDAYKSSFRHESEKAEPGYYSVHLDDYNIDAEFTTTTRTGIHHYTFEKGDSCRFFIDMMHRDELKYYDIGTIGDTIVYGYRVSKGWAEEQHCYFYAVFSKPFTELIQLDITYSDTTAEGKRRSVYEQVQVFSMSFGKIDDLMVKVGISGTDIEGAKNNLLAEAPHWNFNKYRESAKTSWENCLAKAAIEEKNKDVLANYYTALYHCYTVPNTWSDTDGRYRGMDNKIHTAVGYTRYTVFSLWDTFRAYHPLMSELEPERTRDWIHTFLNMYKERGELPVWELAGNETYCMIGYHSVPVIFDAYMRGIRDFDHKLALDAMIKSATGPQEEKIVYNSLGYVPSDQFSESVSKTLEFAYDDWCIAQFAKELGETKIYERFIKRAQNWKNVFDPVTKFMRPRRNGGFPEPFDPYQVDFNYTEANSWQYSFFVPHDIETLIEYHGGQQVFFEDVKALFNAKNKTTGREQSDITGLIGQYAHGNEPSHHAALLFNYGTPCFDPTCFEVLSKTKEKIENLYQNTPEGLCGNEDCGQMSAWYVLAKNNLYPLLPGRPEFITFNPHATADNTYSIGNHPVKASEKIQSKIGEHMILPLPIVMGPQTAFKNEATIRVYCAEPNVKIVLQIHEDIKNEVTGEITERISKEEVISGYEFHIKNNCEISAYATKENYSTSSLSKAVFRKANSDLQLISLTPYNSQYTGGGENALIDEVRGGKDFRTGVWQGWQGQEMVAVLDLGQEKPITTITLSCLEEIKSWIWFPHEVQIYLSHDGKDYALAGTIINEESENNYTPRTKEFTKNLRAYGRYVKIIAKPAFEKIPDWHLGSGNTPWIFADEIIIK
jgi:predicted alpha-1,2-mannosidase